MKLRMLFLIAQAIPVILVLFTAGYGVVGLSRILEIQTQEQSVNTARYAVMAASFANEEARVDALIAQSFHADPAIVAKSRTEFTKHVDQARNWISQFKEEGLAEDVRALRLGWIDAINAYHKSGHAFFERPAFGTPESLALLREIQAKRSAIGAARYKLSPALEELVKISGERVQSEIALFRTYLVLLSVLTLLVCAISYKYLINKVIRPITRIADILDRLRKGETSTVPVTDARDDEIGVLNRSVAYFVEQTVALAQVHADEVRKLEQDKIESARRHAATGTFRVESDKISQMLAGGVETLTATSGTVAGLAKVTSSRTSDFDHAITTTSADIAEISELTRELSNSIVDVAQQVEQCAQSATLASGDVTGSMQRINTLSSEIERVGAVLDTIEMIAGQTNLLALNATIEAARAGEAGRGFSVVATEVKALAGQTAKAVAEIEEVISAIRNTGEDIRKSMETVVTRTQEAARVSNDLSTRFVDQSRAISALSERTDSVSETTQDLTSRAEEISQAARDSASAITDLDTVTDQISEISRQLDRSVAEFVVTVAA